MRFASRLALTALLATSYVSASQLVSRQSSTGDAKCFSVPFLLSVSAPEIMFTCLRRLCVLALQSLDPRSNVSDPYPRGPPKI